MPDKAVDNSGKTLLVVPTYMRSEGDWEITKRCLESLSETVPQEHTIMVVDDYSPYKDGVINIHKMLWDELPQLRSCYMKAENSGFSNSVNMGLRTALKNRMHAVLVNADMEFFDHGWLEHMLATEGDVVGGKLLYPNGLIQHAGIYFSIVTRSFDHLHRFGPADLKAANFKRVCPVTGALQLIRWETLDTVGLYDEDFKMGWEDVDYCLRVFQANKKCVYNPDVVAMHYESAFRGDSNDQISTWTKESWELLHRKHAGANFGQYVPMLIGKDPMEGAA